MMSDQTTSTDLCSICLSPLVQSGKSLYTTPCQHRFHFECLLKSAQTNKSECPLCRTHLDDFVARPLPTPTPTQTREGWWNTMRRSMNNMYSWISRSSIDIFDDQVDERAVRTIAERIQAVRQQVGNVPQITATTALEYGGEVFDQTSNIYGLVTLKAPSLVLANANEKEKTELRAPVDIVCVVDQSGSMSGEKIALLKRTLNYIIDQTNPLDRLAVISFNTVAYNRSRNLLLMRDEKKQRLRDLINRDINAEGGTYIGAGLKMGIDLFRHRRTRNPLGVLLLLTDGQDNQMHDYSSLMETLPDGIVCHTFGYGLGHNALLLSNIAEQGHGGTFTFIDQVTSIDLAFATALGSFFNCVAQNIRVKLEFDNDYSITHTHSIYSHEPETLPSRTLTFKLHDLNAEETRNLVFQIQVPALAAPSADPTPIGRVSLKYNDAISGQQIQTPAVPFHFERPAQLDSASPLRQVNRAVDLQRNRAETSETLRRAVQMRDFAEARALIDAQLAKIRASVSVEDPLCQQLIQDLEYQYRDRNQFFSTMTNMYMQHGQERATYCTVTTISTDFYMTAGQERFRALVGRSKFSS